MMLTDIPTLRESAINMISEGTRLEGRVTFDQVSRIQGTLIGEIQGLPGSTVILGETAMVEGNIAADTLLIDGYVQGDIEARTRVVLTRTGRVIGNIRAPSLQIEFGAYFEGRASMDGTRTK